MNFEIGDDEFDLGEDTGETRAGIKLSCSGSRVGLACSGVDIQVVKT